MARVYPHPMTGIVGGAVSESDLGPMLDSLTREPWHERKQFDGKNLGIGLVHHESKDPGGWTTWQQDERAGVVHGALVDNGTTQHGSDALFEAILDDPMATLPRVDGPFTLACANFDTGQVVVATDKIGSRPCYYSTDNGLLFGSGLGSILCHLDDPVLNEQAVSDVLLMGYVWGEKTLIEGVKALPPATVLVYEDGEATTERYWKPDFSPLSTEGYTTGLIEQYRETMADVTTTVEGTAGIYLSGGLDSRAVAAELNRHSGPGRNLRELVAYTYDANPQGGGNPKLARRIAETLGIDIDTVMVTPETFLENIEKAVNLTDGMLRWSSSFNLFSVYELPEPEADVIFEGSGLGEFAGETPQRQYLTEFDSVVESMYESEAITDSDTVTNLLEPRVSPLRSFTQAAESSDEEIFEERVVDVYFTNHLPRKVFASDTIPQSRTGTRVPFAHGEFLDYAASLPLRYRMRSIPFTNGRIPYGVTRPNLNLTRALDPRLARIPYEHSSLPLIYPFAAHVCGFIATTAFARLSGQTTYGGQNVLDQWYRNRDDVRAFIDGLLSDACERAVFNADEIQRLRNEHLSGEANHMVGLLSSITTLEIWMQQHLD